MRILITGGAGFIGSHLAEHLCSKGHSVVAFDRKLSLAPWVDEYVRGDCRDVAHLKSWARNCHFIYHLASTVGVKNVLADPKEAIENIIDSTRAVLSLGVPGMYFSTSEVYGRNQETLREDSEIRLTSKARWSYAGAKLICEWLALEAGWKVVRPFNVIGPRQNLAYGAVVPNFVQAALKGEPLEVYGDGEQVRTFIDVKDFVEIVDQLTGKEFDVVNVSGESSVRIGTLAGLVRDLLNPDALIQYRSHEAVFGPGFEECYRRFPDRAKLGSLIGKRSYRSLNESISEIADSLAGTYDSPEPFRLGQSI